MDENLRTEDIIREENLVYKNHLSLQITSCIIVRVVATELHTD
jgi:hypothetical protein